MKRSLFTTLLFILAFCSFAAATVIDFPSPDLPDRQRRKWGNFFCSLGFWALASAISNIYFTSANG